jgi:hypothetical protein
MSVSERPDVRLRPDTVDALLEAVRDLLRTEDTRSQGLNGRGTALTGFVGIIVSVSATVGKAILSGSGVHDGWRTAAAWVLGIGLVLLMLSVVSVVWGVLLPQSSVAIATSEVGLFAEPEYVFREKVMVQGSILRGLIDVLAAERDANGHKADWLKASYLLLTSGLVLVAAEALILGYEAIQ